MGKLPGVNYPGNYLSTQVITSGNYLTVGDGLGCACVGSHVRVRA